MMMKGEPTFEWEPNQPRVSKIVFIGKGLDKYALVVALLLAKAVCAILSLSLCLVWPGVALAPLSLRLCCLSLCVRLIFVCCMLSCSPSDSLDRAEISGAFFKCLAE
jgi:hypothetical protein